MATNTHHKPDCKRDYLNVETHNIIAGLAITLEIDISVYDEKGQLVAEFTHPTVKCNNIKIVVCKDMTIYSYDESNKIKEGSFNPYGNGQTTVKSFTECLELFKTISSNESSVSIKSINAKPYSDTFIEQVYNPFAILLCRDQYPCVAINHYNIPEESEIDWPSGAEFDYDDVSCEVCTQNADVINKYEGVGKIEHGNNKIINESRTAKKIESKTNATKPIRSVQGASTQNQIKRCYKCGSSSHIAKNCDMESLNILADENKETAPCKCRITKTEIMHRIASRLTNDMKSDIQVLTQLILREINSGLVTNRKFLRICLENKEVTKIGQFLLYIYMRSGLGGVIDASRMHCRYNLQMKNISICDQYITESYISVLQGASKHSCLDFASMWIRDLTDEGIEPNPGPDPINESIVTPSNSEAKAIKRKIRSSKLKLLQHRPIEYSRAAANYYKHQIMDEARKLYGHDITEEKINEIIESNQDAGVIDKLITNIGHYVFGPKNFLGPGYMGGSFEKIKNINELAQRLAIPSMDEVDEAAKLHDLTYTLTNDKDQRIAADKMLIHTTKDNLLDNMFAVKNAPVFSHLFDYLISSHQPKHELRANKEDLSIDGDVEKNPGPIDLAKLLAAIKAYLNTYGTTRTLLTNTAISIGLQKSPRLQNIFLAYMQKFIFKSKFTNFERFANRDGIMDCYTSLLDTYPDATGAVPPTPFLLGAANYWVQTTWGQIEHGAGDKLIVAGIAETYVGGLDQYDRILGAFRSNTPIENGDLSYMIYFLTKTDDTLTTLKVNPAGGNNCDILYNIWMLALTMNENALWCPLHLRCEGTYAICDGDLGLTVGSIWPRYPDTTWTAWVLSAQDFINYNLGNVQLNAALAGAHVTFVMVTSDMLNAKNDLAKFVWFASGGPFGLCQVNSLWDVGVWTDNVSGRVSVGSNGVDFGQSVAMSISQPKHIILVRCDLGNSVVGAPVAWQVNWQNNFITSAANNAVAGSGGIAFNLRRPNGAGVDSTLAYLQALKLSGNETSFVTAERWWVQLFGNKNDYRAAKLMVAINNFGYLPVPSFALTNLNTTNNAVPDMLVPPVQAFAQINKIRMDSAANVQHVFGGQPGWNARFKDCMGIEKQLIFINGSQGAQDQMQYTVAPMSAVRKYALAHGVRKYNDDVKLLLSEISPCNTNQSFFELMELSVCIRRTRDELQRSTGMSEWTLLGNMLNQAGGVDIGTLMPELNTNFFDSTMMLCGVTDWFKQVKGLSYNHPQNNGRSKTQQYVYDYTFCGTPFYVNDATETTREPLKNENALVITEAWNGNATGVFGVFDPIKDIDLSKRFYFDYRFWSLFRTTGPIQALGSIAFNECDVKVATVAHQCATNSITLLWTKVAELLVGDILPGDVSYTYRDYVPDFTGIIVSGESQNRPVQIAVTSGSERTMIAGEYNAYVMLDHIGNYSTTTLNFTNVIRLPPLAANIFRSGRETITVDENDTGTKK